MQKTSKNGEYWGPNPYPNSKLETGNWKLETADRQIHVEKWRKSKIEN